MEEAKLSLAMRQQLEEKMKLGKPLPNVKRRTMSAPPRTTNNLFGMKKNEFFSKRSRQQIEEAGNYDLDPYRPLRNPVDLEKEKEILQEIMEFGEKMPKNRSKNHTKKKKKEIISRENRLAELALEIEERVQFLDDMTSLGYRKRYENEIKQQVAEKLREVEKLHRMTDDTFAELKITTRNFTHQPTD